MQSVFSKRWFLFGTLATLGLFAACVDGEDPSAAVTGPVTETAVTIDSTGAHVVAQREVSVEEQLAEIEARAPDENGVHRSASTVRDSACAYTSLWIYDQTNFTGNRACLMRSGPYGGAVALSSVLHICSYTPAFPRPIITCDNWENKVRSYLGGTDSGWFSGFHPWVGYGYENFGAWASMPVSGFFADNSYSVTIEPVVH